MPRLRRSLLVISPGVLCSLLFYFFTLTTNLRAQTQQNGISAKEGNAISPLTVNFDYLWADSTVLRWMVSLDGGTAVPMSIWPCGSLAGGMVYSTTNTGTDLETCLPYPITIDTGVPLLVGSAHAQWGSTYLNLQANPLVAELANSATSSTATNFLVIMTGTSNQVKTALTSTTQGVEGICIGGCGGAVGTVVQIAREGIAGCAFDGATTAGDYVQISTTAGKCRDTGSVNYPTNGNQVLGRVLSSNGSFGTYAMVLYSAGIIPPNQGASPCANQVVTGLNNATGPTCTTITSAYVDSTVLTGAHYAPIPASDSISAAGSFATTQSISNAGLKAGSMIIVRAHGRFTTTGTSSPLINLQINAGGTTGICPQASGSAISPGINLTNAYWEAECFISIQTTGGPGTASVWGKWGTSGTVQAQLAGKVFGQTANQNYTTTSAQTLSVQETATFVTGQSMILDALDIQVTY
jgi:hypothetical protein